MRFFLAVPTDLQPERESVRRVVERLNAERGDDPIEIVDWHTLVAPFANLTESVAFRNLEVGPDDIFLGMSWLAFDGDDRPPVTGTGSDGDGDEENGDVGCTERDLELAYAFWKTLPRPRAIFARCLRPPASLAEIDSRAFDRLSLFYRRFDQPEKNPFSYLAFDRAEDLEKKLDTELREVIARETPKKEEAPSERPRSELRGSTQFEKKMEPGKAYEVSFLGLEIDGWDQIVEKHGEEKDALQTLASSFLELVRSTARNYGGEVFSWSVHGGLLIFWTRRSVDHAVMTGLKVLHNLPVFNLDPQQNPLGEDVSVRAAAQFATIVFQLPIEEISAREMKFLGALLEQNTDGDELTITRAVQERIDERLRPHFQSKERFEGEMIHSCQLPSARQDTERADVEDSVERMRRQTSLAGGLLQTSASGLDGAAADSLASAVDEAYSVLNKFCAAYSSIDRDWSPQFFARLAEAAATLRREEGNLWRRLRERSGEAGLPANIDRRLGALAQAASRRRSRSVVLLEKLEERCRTLAEGSEPKAPAPRRDLEKDLLDAIDAFVKADDLDEETRLTELLLHHKKGLLAYVAERANDGERHARLMKKLWESADLALLDDLYSIRGHRRRDEARIFDVMVRPEVAHSRFQVVRDLLDAEERPDEVALGRRFEALGAKATAQDLQVVWRCLILGHADEKMRQVSAAKLSPHSMWRVVSHPSIPINAIHALGERMSKSEGDDAKKIYFDCTRSRIEQAVESFRTREELETLTKLILLYLNFSFLVETGYFERFDDLLGKFLGHAQSMGMQIDYFENLRRTLEKARVDAGEKGPAKPPAGIKSLPLTIQRRLAGESRYIYWFVTHPDPRIACETLRHIGLVHVERVLRLREINSSVLLAILRRSELFTRSQAILAALNHPKCTQEFANKYVPTLARSRQSRQALEKVAQNPSASPVVRSTAKRALENVAKRTRRA